MLAVMKKEAAVKGKFKEVKRGGAFATDSILSRSKGKNNNQN